MARKKSNDTSGRSKTIDISQVIKTNEKEINPISRSIRRYREQIGMEQKELAMRLGVSANAVSNWETGITKPTITSVIPICEILGITLYQLFDVDDPLMKYSAGEQLLISDYRDLSMYHKKAVDDMVKNLKRAEVIEDIPEITKLIYFNRQLAAGIGDPTDLDDDGEPLYLYSSDIINKADYVFTVNGESMEPEYHNGDMVLIHRFPDCGDILPGEVGAFIIGSEAYIKEYQKDGLHSYNNKYKTMKFGEEDKVYYIGKVIGTIDSGDVASEYDIERYTALHGE